MNEFDDATLISRLIDYGCTAVSGRFLELDENFENVEAQVKKRWRTPHEGERIISQRHVSVCDALRFFNGARLADDIHETTFWAQLIGVMLPPLRRDLSHALVLRSKQRPTTTQA